MKNFKTLLFTIAVLFFANLTQAKIWRVNNNIGISANFTTAQAAHDAALTLAGDTLMFEGSNVVYGALRFTKRLTVIGPGYFLGSNPETQAFFVDAKIQGMSFAAGSENSSVQGINCNAVAIYIGTSNITFSRNYNISQLYIGFDPTCCQKNVSNILISQNFSINQILTTGNPVNNGILITNNYFGQISLELNTSALIKNNVITSSGDVINSTNCLFANNILVSGTINSAASNNTYNNNISATAAWTPSGSNIGANNQTNVAMTDVFTIPVNGLVETSFQLKNPGLGINTAQGGGDCGIFGGTTPYVLSGMPSVPSVYFYNVPATGSNTNPLNISIKAKSRN